MVNKWPLNTVQTNDWLRICFFVNLVTFCTFVNVHCIIVNIFFPFCLITVKLLKPNITFFFPATQSSASHSSYLAIYVSLRSTENCNFYTSIAFKTPLYQLPTARQDHPTIRHFRKQYDIDKYASVTKAKYANRNREPPLTKTFA